MSKASHSGDHQRDHEFNRIVHEYYRAVEAGESPDREEWIARYPLFAEELDSFLSDVNRVAGPPAPAALPARVLDRAVLPVSKFEWDRDDTPETRSERTLANAVENAGHEVNVDDRLPRTTEFIRDYLLLKKLGEGGFGSVYLAVHTQLEKRVAIKVLKGDGGRDRKLVERFCREIKAVGKFEHDHIVRAFDAGKIDGLYFLVMEFIDGCDLADLSAGAGPLSVGDACELIRQAALGLQHAHEAGLVHRDVKPSNLMLTAEGQVKLLDLGLAQLRQRYHQSTALTADGQAMGTWKYMAPEQFEDSGRVDAACDIFALGVTLYQLLRGGLPTTGPHAAVEYTDLKTYRGDVPDEVVELIGEMTHLDPAQRIGNAGEVIHRLDPWTEGHDLVKLYQQANQKRLPAANHPIPAPPPLARQMAATQDGAVQSSSGKPLSPLESKARQLSPSGNRVNLAGGGIAAIALLTLLFGMLGSWNWWGDDETQNHGVVKPNGPATLVIEVSESVDPQQSQRFRGFLFNTETEKPHSLVVGINEVPPGRYRLDLGKWVTRTPATLPNTILLEPGIPLPIEVAPRIVQPTGHVLYPTIPKREGAWAEFSTNVMPVGQGEVLPQNYNIRLQALNREIVDSREFQWLEVSVDHPGHYRETAWILFDPELYEQEQELRVERGYVEIALHEERGGLLEPVKNTLTARWSDEVDPLNELADDLQIEWPENRVKPLSVLSVLFDYSHPAVDDAISQLWTEMGSLPIQPWSEVDHYTGVGYFPALKIFASSDPSEPEQGLEYTIIRVQKDEAVPFSFLDVELRSSRLEVLFHLSKMGSESRRDSVDLVSLEHAVASLEDFASPPPDDYDFTRATLPEEDGSWCRYLADPLKFGGEELRAVAQIRAGKRVPVDGSLGRWIEVVVEEPTWEAAKLLIDEEAYNSGGEFRVLRGYHSIGGHVFDFRDGDTQVTEQALACLKGQRKFSPSRFGVREVLALLFDASLPPGDPLAALRTQIESSIAKESTERKPRVCEIQEKGPKQSKYLGHEWTLDKNDNPDFVYDVAHSRAIPFGFGFVELSLPGFFEIETNLSEAGTKPDLLGSEEVLIQKAAKTRHELDEKGVHVWTIDGEAELWRLDRYRLDRVYLRDLESTRKLELKWQDLTSEEDQQWVMKTQGRQWRWEDSNGRNHEETALLQSIDGYEKIRLRCEDNEIITVEYDWLSLQDQKFVDDERFR